MNLEADIKKEQKKLIKKAKEHGIYENFGQKEVRKLRDKYGDGGANFKALDKINKFDKWCMNYQG